MERPSTPGQADEALGGEVLPPGAEPLRSGDPAAINGHRLTGRLASGGTSIVYLARDPQGRHVTVKTTRARQADQAQARRWLRTEAACSRRLPPFCTAPLLVDGSDQTPPYLISEYVEGPSLAQYVDVLGPLEHDQMGALAIALALAISAVHGAGLIHCDLQPGNILLASDGPRVIDFSIAQEAPISGRPAQVGTVPYSPGWVAPERLGGHPAGPASDVFGWGCLIGYAATGHSPFDGEEVEEGCRSVARSADLDAIEEPLRGVVEAALAVDPADRPSTGEIVARLGGGRAEVVPAAEPAPPWHETDLIPFSTPPGVDEPTAPMPRIAPAPEAGGFPPAAPPVPAPRDDRPLPAPTRPVPALRDDRPLPPPERPVPALRDDRPAPERPLPALRDDRPPRQLDHPADRPDRRAAATHADRAAGMPTGPGGPKALPPAPGAADGIPLATVGPRPRRDPRRPRRLRAVAMVTAPAALVAVLATALAMAGTGDSNGQAPTVPGGAPTIGQSPVDPSTSTSPSEPSRRSNGPRPDSASSEPDGSESPGAGQQGPGRPGTPSRPGGGGSHRPTHSPSSPSPTPTHSPTPSPTPTATGTGPKVSASGTPTSPGTTR